MQDPSRPWAAAVPRAAAVDPAPAGGRERADCAPPNHRAAKRAIVRAEGYDLAFQEAGTGPDVVLLHGTLTSLDDMMLALGGDLARNHHVVAFDRPGHGASTRPPADGSLMTQARLVVAGMRALGLERPVLVGHSAGGALALTIATHFPEVLAGVVAVAPLVFFEPRIEMLLFGPRGVPFVGPLAAESWTRPFDGLLLPVLWNAMFVPQKMPASYAARFPFATMASPAEMTTTGEDAALLGFDLLRNTPLYPACEVPVRILGGTDDIVVNNRLQGYPLSLVMPDCSFDWVEGMGHMLHHFVPALVAAKVEDLSSIE